MTTEAQAAMCEGKQPFNDFAMASAVAKRMRGRVSVYRCRFCGKWHVGRLK